jgi:hypothetical protein
LFISLLQAQLLERLVLQDHQAELVQVVLQVFMELAVMVVQVDPLRHQMVVQVVVAAMLLQEELAVQALLVELAVQVVKH